MFPLRRRRGVRRGGPLGRAAKKSSRRTLGRRILVRFAVRVARPFAPGMLAGALGSYFLNRKAGSARRKRALDKIGGKVGRVRGGKG